LIARVAREDHELWIDTGDLLGDTQLPSLSQAAWQQSCIERWRLGERLRKALAGRPCVLIRGNHDAVSLRVGRGTPPAWLAVVRSSYSPTLAGHPVYGYGMAKERLRVKQALPSFDSASFVVAHVPPVGQWSCPVLREVYEEREDLKFLVGHVHEWGGSWSPCGRVHNAACHMSLLDIPLPLP
jgi:hypothetical protein